MELHLKENQLKIKEHNSRLGLLSGDERFEQYTDFISDYQEVLCWGFDSEVLMSAYGAANYSVPVRRALFAGFKAVAESGNRRVRERCFTVWMGDYGDENRYFWAALPGRMLHQVGEAVSSCFTGLRGFMFNEFGTVPRISLVPVYRYECGRVVEYAYEDSLAGRMRIDSEFGTGLTVLYRRWLSAEEFFVKERYLG